MRIFVVYLAGLFAGSALTLLVLASSGLIGCAS